MSNFSILAHHWAGLEKLKFPTSNILVSKKYNGWNMLYDGGISEGCLTDEVPWVNSKDRVPYSGFCTIGRSNGPQPIYPPDWWSKPFRDIFRGVPVQGELWCPATDSTSDVKSIAGQGWEKSYKDTRWRTLVFVPCNIKPYYLWTEYFEAARKGFNPQSLDIVKSSNFYLDTTLSSKLLMIKGRVESHEQLFPDYYPIIANPQHTLDSDPNNFNSSLQEVINGLPGEGIMLANGEARYTLGRSYDLLKIKGIYETEATVVNYVPGKDGFTGMVGSLICQLTWDEKVASVYGGKESMIGKDVSFCVSGLSHEKRELSYYKEHLLGKSVCFKYLGVTNYAIPVSANYLY